MRHIAAAVVLGSLAFAANAAEPQIGTVSIASGTVSVSNNGTFTKAVNGSPLMEGSTVMVSTGARAKLMLANGCTLQLRSGQYITVSAKLGCDQLVASTQQMFSAYSVAQVGGTAAPAATGGAAALGPLIGIGIVAGVAAADISTNEDDAPVSGR